MKKYISITVLLLMSMIGMAQQRLFVIPCEYNQYKNGKVLKQENAVFVGQSSPGSKKHNDISIAIYNIETKQAYIKFEGNVDDNNPIIIEHSKEVNTTFITQYTGRKEPIIAVYHNIGGVNSDAVGIIRIDEDTEHQFLYDKSKLMEMIMWIAHNKTVGNLPDPKRFAEKLNQNENKISDGLLGNFTVNSSGKKVQFTKGNLYWDGNAYHMEKKQTDYPTNWNANHVGHFFWTSLNDYKSNDTSIMPFVRNYSYNNRSDSDKLFCTEENPITVDGIYGLFALSFDEWTYLIHHRPNAKSLLRYDVTVDDSHNCLIIAPDGFTGTLKDSYTLNEVNNLGLVCLPNAGSRYYSTISGGWGRYWTSTRSTAGMNNKCAWELYFKEGHVDTAPNDRDKGLSLRLVRVAK